MHGGHCRKKTQRGAGPEDEQLAPASLAPARPARKAALCAKSLAGLRFPPTAGPWARSCAHRAFSGC